MSGKFQAMAGWCMLVLVMLNASGSRAETNIQLDKALAKCSATLEHDSRSLEALLNRGLIYLIEKKYPQAFTDYQNLLIALPKASYIKTVSGSIVQIGDSVTEYDLAFAAYLPEQLQALRTAVVGKEPSKIKPNLQYFSPLAAVLEFNPAYIGLINHGLAQKMRGDLALALADYDRAIKIMPDTYLAYYNRGNIHRLKNENGLALKDYFQALKNITDPEVKNDVQKLITSLQSR